MKVPLDSRIQKRESYRRTIDWLKIIDWFPWL